MTRAEEAAEVVKRLYVATGFPPSLAEIAKEMGLKGRSSVLPHIDAAVFLGLVHAGPRYMARRWIPLADVPGEPPGEDQAGQGE